MLKKQGLEPDLIDVEAMVDSELTLSENARIIKEDLSVIMQNQEKIGLTSQNKVERFLKAVEYFDTKTVRQRYMDGNRQAQKTFEKSELNEENYKKWHHNTNRYDILGVDSKYG